MHGSAVENALELISSAFLNEVIVEDFVAEIFVEGQLLSSGIDQIKKCTVDGHDKLKK